MGGILASFRYYTRFERARIIGARALQISMGAPTLLLTESGAVDPIEIATFEYQSGSIPLSVQRFGHALN
ncbi:MAG: DNA-directed RNA polymerase subunit K [Candidatus Thermoplasmatota archaeon]